MTQLLQRYCAVTIGTLRLSNLKMAINVSKNSKPEPNKAKVQIWNLNREHRQALMSQPRNVAVQIDAGYEQAYSTIYVGELRFSDHRRENRVDVITTIETADKAAVMQTARVSVTLPKGGQSGDALRELAKALGVGANRSTAWGGRGIEEGNLNDAVALMKSNTLFASGTCFTGMAWREMNNACRALGLVWSVQDGKLQILRVGQGLKGRAIRLTEETGLIGSPSVDQKGFLSASMLMIPDVFPGRVISLESEFVNGSFVIEESSHSGTYSPDEVDGDWKIDVKAKGY